MERQDGPVRHGTRVSPLRWFATHVFNPFARPFAGTLPGFGIVTHVGRRSGRTYRTPVNVFRQGDRITFALVDGADVSVEPPDPARDSG